MRMSVTNILLKGIFKVRLKNFFTGAYLFLVSSCGSGKKNETDLTLRYYGFGAQIIKDHNIENMILLSRTKKKIIGLEGFGLKIKKQIIIK